ncbi:hypothetical protein CJF32_00009096 [Rutstroemia sp. NJR-2017a WRK4]|nr:hypothetical protein CJF32_00009096 [Rutstroemia sp. NJR-2017a WRK4]
MSPTTTTIISPQNQTLLMSKRISTFLHSNLSPQLHTLLLLTPTGKLLSSSSSAPASVLRHQGTLALSLWTLYSPFPSDAIADALPNSDERQRARDSERERGRDRGTKSILIQMEFGIMVIRRLRCGLLFVAIGPGPTTAGNANGIASKSGINTPQLQSSPGTPERERDAGAGGIGGSGGEASETASVRSVKGLGIMGMRSQAEALGDWLDGKLDGLVLCEGDSR